MSFNDILNNVDALEPDELIDEEIPADEELPEGMSYRSYNSGADK